MSILAENILGRALTMKGRPSTCDCKLCRGARSVIDREMEPIRAAFALGILCPTCDGCGSKADGSDCPDCAAIQIACDLLAVEGAS